MSPRLVKGRYSIIYKACIKILISNVMRIFGLTASELLELFSGEYHRVFVLFLPPFCFCSLRVKAFIFEHVTRVLVFRSSSFLGYTVYKFYFQQSLEKSFHAGRKSTTILCNAPNTFAVHFFHQQINLMKIFYYTHYAPVRQI